MNIFPKRDIPLSLRDAITKDLAIPARLEEYHRLAEETIPSYTATHLAINHAAQSTVDSPDLRQAVAHGVSLFEAIGGFSQNILPAMSADSFETQVLAQVGTGWFMTSLKAGDDFLRAMEVATFHMQYDTPVLHDTLDRALDLYAGNDAIKREVALGGAAVARSMQVYINNRVFDLVALEPEDTDI